MLFFSMCFSSPMQAMRRICFECGVVVGCAILCSSAMLMSQCFAAGGVCLHAAGCGLSLKAIWSEC